jgi:alpha-glucosidase (family GH31 glycosyl hydrolase)
VFEQYIKHFLKCYASVVILLLPAVCMSHAQGALVAIHLGPAVDRPPQSLSDWNAAVRVNRFVPANGETAQTTATSAFLAWDSTALYVRFLCSDPDPVYRNGVRVRRTDRVEVGILPPGGKQEDLWQFSADEAGMASVTHESIKNKMQGAAVMVDGSEWSADLTIPWLQLGGVPAKAFLLQLSRVRSITGELLSPSAVDFHDGPVSTFLAPAAIDEFMEVTLGGKKETLTSDFGLITLPSGTQRWERRGFRHIATNQELKAIARLQQELDTQPTSQANMVDRVRMAEIWYCLLEQEGVSLHTEGGTWLLNPGELDPWTARHKFNDALAAGDVPGACRILDSLLQHFNRVSKSWFADGTPGDVRNDAWTSIDTIESAAVASNEIFLHARTRGKNIDLQVSFPSIGGVRLHGSTTGFFSPEALLPMKLKHTESEVRASANNLTVVIGLKANWHIDIFASDHAKPIWSLRQGNLRIRKEANGSINGVEISGDLASSEAIFGMGERFDSFNQRGKTLTLWQQDAYDSLCQGGLQNLAYKTIPLWHSTSGYSVFWNSTYELRADFGNSQKDAYRITTHGPILDLYIWAGDYQEVLRSYTSLTGKPWMPPVWAFEAWMGGGGDRWGRTVGETPTQAILDVVDKFQSLDIPHSSVYAEGTASDDPLLYSKLDPLNIHVLTWARSEPLHSTGPSAGWSIDEIKQALPGVSTNRLPIMRVADGLEYSFPPEHILGDQFPYFDFTDPKSIDLLRVYWRPRLDLGVAGSMLDFGDLVPREALFHDGSTGEQMHNWYAHLYHHYVHQIFSERRGEDHVLFARGGAPGSQAEVAQMGGDHSSNFRGMDESIAGGLSVSASAFSNWGVDVGGYDGKPDEEVYVRWVEYGTFSPLMRFHGNQPREPWYYSDFAVGTYKKYAWLRENLVPYLYGSAQDTHAQGIPLMRPLPSVATDEYMFGDDLLVAPVHTPGEHRTINLPNGQWTSLWTGLLVADGKRNISVPLDEIPVYLRAGALIPVDIAPDFCLGQSMTSGRVPALLLTPPDRERTSHAWKLPGKDGITQLKVSKQESGFQLVVENWQELRYLIVSGLQARIKNLIVDGQFLPELASQQSESLPPGWKQLDQGRILVRLPAARLHVVDFSTTQ